MGNGFNFFQDYWTDADGITHQFDDMSVEHLERVWDKLLTNAEYNKANFVGFLATTDADRLLKMSTMGQGILNALTRKKYSLQDKT